MKFFSCLRHLWIQSAAPLKSVVLILASLCLMPPAAEADGGVIQFRQQAGTMTITLFSTPVPLRAGRADLSVLVEDAATLDAILDAKVSLSLRRNDDSPLTVKATRQEATNKLLYAANPVIARPGKWQVSIAVIRGPTQAEVHGVVKVLPAPPTIIAYWPYFAVVPIAISLFVLNQWLKARQKAVRSA